MSRKKTEQAQQLSPNEAEVSTASAGEQSQSTSGEKAEQDAADEALLRSAWQSVTARHENTNPLPRHRSTAAEELTCAACPRPIAVGARYSTVLRHGQPLTAHITCARRLY